VYTWFPRQPVDRVAGSDPRGNRAGGRCRKAFGLSQPAIARALLIASDRTIRRWEQDELTVAGPA
jgi:hypothetical protein